MLRTHLCHGALMGCAIACAPAALAPSAAAQHPLAVTITSPLKPVESLYEGAAVTLAIDEQAMTGLQHARRALIDEFPLGPGRQVSLDLKRIEAFAPDAKIVVASEDPAARGRIIEQPLPLPAVMTFGGRVVGEDDSSAFIALSPYGQHGWVRSGGRTYILSSGPFGAQPPLPAMIFDRDALPPGAIVWSQDPFCRADELKPVVDQPAAAAPEDGGLAGGSPPCRQARLAIETDYEFTWVRFGGNTHAAASYAATLVAAMTQIYVTDVNTRFGITFLRLWTTPSDPWTATGAGSQLTEFRNYWQANMDSVPRNLAHFFSARGLGGGVAWLSVLCDSTFNYAVSGNLSGFFPYPLQNNHGQNWDMMVVAHETGHNFSSPHTHSYDPPIDGCGSGDCTNANQGTIMSYCHTCTGGMSNIVLSLHPIVSQRILTYMGGLECDLTGETLAPVPATDRAWSTEGGTITLDVLANDLETSCDTLTIDSFDAVSANGGAVTLSPGSGPNGRDQLVYTAPIGFNGIDSFAYVVRDGANMLGSAQVEVRVYGYLPATTLAQSQPGVKARYYALTTPSVLPNYAALTPYLVNTATLVNFASTSGNFAGSGLANEVGAVFTGFVDVPTTGLYTFYCESDDGSRLWVDDQIVVAHDGTHGMTERAGLVGLQAGRHRVKIEYFERTGGAGLIARYSGPGVSKQVIPSSNWRRAIPADVTESGAVDVDDLIAVILGWGPCVGGCEADVNGSGAVDVDDLIEVILNWG